MAADPIHLEKTENEHVTRINTAQSVNMTMELFEKLYLSPENKVKGELRRTFANPTPLPILGFLIASSPLAAALMGWGGAGGGGAATIGTYYFFGGMLQVIGSLLEWFIGNTFPFVVFGSLGAFWLAFAATLTPAYNAEAAFTAGATTAAEKAAGVAQFQASLAFFLLFMGILGIMFLICAIRTNLVFVLIFIFLDTALFLLTAAYFQASRGNLKAFHTLSVASGATVFCLCICAWYLLFAQLLQSVDFPLDLPVVDLSSRFKGKTARDRARDVEKQE